MDTDLPTAVEGWMFDRPLTKLVWLALQPFFYAFRPMLVYQRNVTDVEAVNWIVILISDYAIAQVFGEILNSDTRKTLVSVNLNVLVIGIYYWMGYNWFLHVRSDVAPKDSASLPWVRK